MPRYLSSAANSLSSRIAGCRRRYLSQGRLLVSWISRDHQVCYKKFHSPYTSFPNSVGLVRNNNNYLDAAAKRNQQISKNLSPTFQHRLTPLHQLPFWVTHRNIKKVFACYSEWPLWRCFEKPRVSVLPKFL